MNRIGWAVVATFAVLAACRGPKSTPEDTMDSYFSALGAHDIDALMSMTDPSAIKKYGEKKIRTYFDEDTVGMQSLTVQKQVAQAGETAQAQAVLNYTWRIRGQSPEAHDGEYRSYYLRHIDGKWYVDLPGNAKIQPW